MSCQLTEIKGTFRGRQWNQKGVMRITCDVEVVNRLLPAFNLKGKGKACRSQLSVGRKPGQEKDGQIYLMMCTKQDRNGAKYRLKGNVQQFFAKFLQEGKATIRIKEPPHDLCLSKGDPVQMKGFLSVVRMACQGENLEKVTLAPLAPVSAKQVERLKTKMCITNRRDYPITSGFPSSLEHLQVTQCTLKKVDSRILALHRLRILDLSHNRLQALPEETDGIATLNELHLADNQLADIPRGFCSGSLSKSLTMLDLTENKLKILKPHFCDLVSLVTLKLDHNELVCLPNNLGKLRRLRFLSAAKNQLRTVPATFGQLSLEELDLYENPFLQDGPSTTRNRLQFPTLHELAARAVKNHRCQYTEEDLPGHVMEFLTTAKKCLCGSWCFSSFVHYLARLDLHRVAASLTAIDTNGRTNVPAEAFLCSQACLNKYQKNPYATIWKK